MFCSVFHVDPTSIRTMSPRCHLVRHRQKLLTDEADDDEVVPTNIPATLYEGGDTTRSSKERASPILVRERPVSMAEPRSPTFELTPRITKDRERARANTHK